MLRGLGVNGVNNLQVKKIPGKQLTKQFYLPTPVPTELFGGSPQDLDTWLICPWLVYKSPKWDYSPYKWPKWRVNRGY